ncbi:MAG: glycosyltransferase family 4 protein [Anaerolineales bacterium]|nr:glycosyltransferase family 4 protein [Anaerolineales bacterium]
MPPLKILLAHNYYLQAGGEDVVFSNEKNILEEAGHEVITYERNNSEIEHLSMVGKLSLLPTSVWAQDSFQDFNQIIERHKPQIVHLINTFPLISPSVYYASQRANIPVIQSIYNYRLLCPSAVFYRNGKICEECLGKAIPWPGIVHACYRNSRMGTATIASMLASHKLLGTWRKQVDTYIVATDFIRKKLIRGGLPASKIVVKPNYVSKDPGIRKGSKDFAVFVGRLTAEKGVWTLLEAWKSLPDIGLKIVGDGPLWDDLTSYHKVSGENNVEFVGRLSKEEMLNLIKEARFLVFPSEWYEGFPMILVEAFACAVPVIASNIGTISDIVSNGNNGLTFNNGDSIDLANKVKWALSNSEKMEKLGLNARKEYELRYTAQKNYEVLYGIYKSVILSKSSK